MKDGLWLIKKERQRQISEEGYSVERDRQLYKNNELFLAACCYYGIERSRAINDDIDFYPADSWPWHRQWWKPSPENRLRELEKAGALFMAHNHMKGKTNLIDEWVEMCAKDIDKLLVEAQPS